MRPNSGGSFSCQPCKPPLSFILHSSSSDTTHAIASRSAQYGTFLFPLDALYYKHRKVERRSDCFFTPASEARTGGLGACPHECGKRELLRWLARRSCRALRHRASGLSRRPKAPAPRRLLGAASCDLLHNHAFRRAVHGNDLLPWSC